MMTPSQIREAVNGLASNTVSGEEAAWDKLRPLGEDVVPYLRAAYPKFGGWRGRCSLVYHCLHYARTSEDAFQLGLAALSDKSTIVRYRACGVMAYSLRRDALEALRQLLNHADMRTVEDASAAIKAIEAQNHHLFIDRRNSGQSFWVVNEGDRNST